MRFSEFANDLGDEGTATLVNTLTLGSGRLAHAARLVTDDGDAAQVLRSLDLAFGALLRARRLLNGQAPDAADAPDSSTASGPLLLRWADFLASRTTEGEAVAFRTALVDAVGHARNAGTAILEDDDIETVQWHLVGAVTALGEARRVVA